MHAKHYDLLGLTSVLSSEKKTTLESAQYTNNKHRKTFTRKAGAGNLTFTANALSKLQVLG